MSSAISARRGLNCARYLTIFPMLRPALFLDRDGVVNRSPGPGYVLSIADFHLNPGIIELLAWAKSQGYFLVLVTSQQGVGKGLMSMLDLECIHAYLQSLLAPHHATFDLIQVCPHLASTCDCRKPSPTLIHQAAALLPIDLTRSVLIGDHDRDIQMAENAHLPYTIRVATENPIHHPAHFTARTIPEAFSALKAWHLTAGV